MMLVKSLGKNRKMIPKIIHYCWLSNDPVPESLQLWMKTWKEKLPDYEFIKWDFNRFEKKSSVWVSEAFDNKKYAFAADYIRCYALYNYGGIYLDMDVEVLKPFDDLLGAPYMLGLESPDGIEAAVMGSEKGAPLFEKMLDYYRNRHFVYDDGTFDQTKLPNIIYDVVRENYSISIVKSGSCIQNVESKNNELILYPWDYFTGKNYPWKENYVDSSTYSVHHCADTWNSKNTYTRLKKKLQKLLGPRISRKIVCLKRRKELKKLEDTLPGYNSKTGMCRE